MTATSAPKAASSAGWKLTEGLGLDSAYVESTEGILPATRFAVEAYVHFVRDKTPLEAIASSLTELLRAEPARRAHLRHAGALRLRQPRYHELFQAGACSRRRATPISRSSSSRSTRRRRRSAKRSAMRCCSRPNVLWVQLDALYHAYVEGHVPPGAFVPQAT